MPRFTKKVTDTKGESRVVTVETTHPGTCVELLASGYTQETELVGTYTQGSEEPVRMDPADPVRSDVADLEKEATEVVLDNAEPAPMTSPDVYPSRHSPSRGSKSKK